MMSTLTLATFLMTAAPTSAVIEGDVRYPGCFPPADLTVCAERIGDRETICTRELGVTDEGQHFTLNVPRGRWVVYATTPSVLPDRRAYFSRAVVCGLDTSCDDHAPIVVRVDRGDHVRDVDPNDWFAPRYEPVTPPFAAATSRARAQNG